MWIIREAKRLVVWLFHAIHTAWSLIAFVARFRNRALLLTDGRFVCHWKDRWPCLNDATATTGFDAHYIYHPAWAARRIFATTPEKHIDISSKLDFVTMLSAFLPVEFYDYRPANIALPGLRCCHADLMALPFENNSIKSLSCMHVVEHIGLERYGDPLDGQGDLKAIRELIRVLALGGSLYFVVPMGEMARIQYNAHRIYTYKQVLSYFGLLSLEDFAFITDDGEFIEKASEDTLVGSKYGCGCFHFIKKELL
jgi:Methylase involved in ubiquinone/menaquinone biosynthesis